jgi:hypothetical protein
MMFQLFIFDSTGVSVGRIQVRTFIKLVGDDSLTAQTAADVIEPNGNVIPNVGSGPFYGKRIKPVPVVTSVQEHGNTAPSSFSLEQNYPNPFNPTTLKGDRRRVWARLSPFAPRPSLITLLPSPFFILSENLVFAGAWIIFRMNATSTQLEI